MRTETPSDSTGPASRFPHTAEALGTVPEQSQHTNGIPSFVATVTKKYEPSHSLLCEILLFFPLAAHPVSASRPRQSATRPDHPHPRPPRYTILYYILYTIYYILYTIYYILYTIYYILYYTILYYTIRIPSPGPPRLRGITASPVRSVG